MSWWWAALVAMWVTALALGPAYARAWFCRFYPREWLLCLAPILGLSFGFVHLLDLRAFGPWTDRLSEADALLLALGALAISALVIPPLSGASWSVYCSPRWVRESIRTFNPHYGLFGPPRTSPPRLRHHRIITPEATHDIDIPRMWARVRPTPAPLTRRWRGPSPTDLLGITLDLHHGAATDLTRWADHTQSHGERRLATTPATVAGHPGLTTLSRAPGARTIRRWHTLIGGTAHTLTLTSADLDTTALTPLALDVAGSWTITPTSADPTGDPRR